MSEKGNFETLLDSSTELLKEGGELIGFTESKDKIDKENKDKIALANEKAQNAVLDVKKDVVKTSILSQLKSGFDNFIKQINSSESIPSEKKQETITEIQQEYQTIKNIIEGYKNDGDFKKGFSVIDTKISNWINGLNDKKSDILTKFAAGDIIDSSIHSLSILKADLGILNNVSQSDIEKSKSQLTEKYKKDSNDEADATNMLTKFGIPAGISGMLVGIGKTMGFFGKSESGEKGFFSNIMDILKNPGKFFMGLFGFGGDESTPKTNTPSIVADTDTTNNDSLKGAAPEKESITVNSQLFDTENGQKYTYNNIILETKEGSFSEILVGNTKYELNINNQPDLGLGDINIEKRNNKDILKVGDSEVDLLTVLNQIDHKNPKNQYTLIPDYRLMGDLVIEKVS